MWKVRIIVATLASIAMAAPTAASAASTGRHDTYYQVWCRTDTGAVVQAESVDARSIQYDKTPGGKDGAIENFTNNFPLGWTCWAVGPFAP